MPALANPLKAVVAVQAQAPIQISSCRGTASDDAAGGLVTVSAAPPVLQQNDIQHGGTTVTQPGTTVPMGSYHGSASTNVAILVAFHNASRISAKAVGFAFQLFDSAHHPIKTFTGLAEGSYAPNARLQPLDGWGSWPWQTSTLDADVASVTCSVIYAKFADGTEWGAVPKD